MPDPSSPATSVGNCTTQWVCTALSHGRLQQDKAVLAACCLLRLSALAACASGCPESPTQHLVPDQPAAFRGSGFGARYSRPSALPPLASQAPSGRPRMLSAARRLVSSSLLRQVAPALTASPCHLGLQATCVPLSGLRAHSAPFLGVRHRPGPAGRRAAAAAAAVCHPPAAPPLLPRPGSAPQPRVTLAEPLSQ